MKLKKFIKTHAFDTKVIIKSQKDSYAQMVNPFEDLLKKKLSVPITLFHL